MDKFVVTNIPAFNGDYPIDIGTFTMRELQIIKRMSGVRAGELEEAFGAGDTSLILAIAVIAVRRSGKNWEAFEQIAWESEVGSIEFHVGEEAADQPIPLTTAPSESSDEQPPPSGLPSQDDGNDHQAMNLQAIGSQH